MCMKRPLEKINIITTITSERDNLDTIWKEVQNATPNINPTSVNSSPKHHRGADDLGLEGNAALRVKTEEDKGLYAQNLNSCPT